MSSNEDEKKISGTVLRVSPPMNDREDACIFFCIEGDERVFSAYLNGNYSARSRCVFLMEKGDQVEFTLREGTRSVCEFTIAGLPVS